MKTPAIIFTLFIVAAGAIIALNKNTPEVTVAPKPKAVVDDITAGSANQPLTSVSFKDSILHKGKMKEGEILNVELKDAPTYNSHLIPNKSKFNSNQTNFNYKKVI